MKTIRYFFYCFLLLAMAASPVYATNGDNLIAIGPYARAMGGVGIAHPQDAIGAVFANPAAMCFGPYCPSSEVNVSTTFFMPDVDAKVSSPTFGTLKDNSDADFFVIPAVGFSLPLGESEKNWRFGFAAYGVSGMGVDYKGTAIDTTNYPIIGFPAVAGEFTELSRMKFAPSIAVQPTANLSLGLAVHIGYGILDLNVDKEDDFAYGIQPGLIYRFTDHLSMGVTYTSPMTYKHKGVNDFNGDGILDDLELESPHQIGTGFAYDFFENNLLVEADVKWINWSGAKGYKDFDWEDQWVFGIGAQWEPIEKWSFRAGYNYAKSPVKENSGWTGTSLTNVQGKVFPRYYYETFRVVGFPAITEHHLTLGIGYQWTESLFINLGVMYSPENSIKETGTDLFGAPVTIESTMSQTSIDFGVTWRF